MLYPTGKAGHHIFLFATPPPTETRAQRSPRSKVGGTHPLTLAQRVHKRLPGWDQNLIFPGHGSARSCRGSGREKGVGLGKEPRKGLAKVLPVS